MQGGEGEGSNEREGGSQGGGGGVIQPDILQHMMTFLRKHGFTEAEETLAREAAAKAQSLPFPGQNAPNHEAIISEFGTLLAHVDASFDFFQAEFALLIFPVFAHSFLKLHLEGHVQLASSFMESYGIRVPSPYEEEVKLFASFSHPEQALAHPTVQNLLKHKFVVKLSKSCLKQLEPLLNRLPSISTIMKERLDIEVSEGVNKLRSTVEWQMGGLLGQVSRHEKRHKMYYGIMREECLYALDRRRCKTKEDAKKREQNAPVPDRIPLPPITDALRLERIRMHKEMQKMVVLGVDCPPSVCFYSTLNAHGGVSSCDVSEDSGLLALGFGDSGISVFALNDACRMRKLKAAEELDKLEQESEEISEEMLEPHGSSVIALNGHSSPVYSLNFSPDKRLLLSTSGDGTIRLWSMQTMTNVVVIREGSPVWQAAFCQRGYYFATGSASKTAAVWATERLQPLRIFADSLSQVSSVDFHANCNYVAGGSDDRYVRVWDVLSGVCVRTFAGHRAAVRSVKFSPCGRYVTSVSSDGVLCVWDLSMQRLLGADTREFPTRIPSISYSRDGGMFAVSRGGSELSLYSLDNLIMATNQSNMDYNSYDPKLDMDGFETHSFATKDTPVVGVHFTRRNLVVGIGAFNQ